MSAMLLMTSCIEETFPQTSYVTVDQAAVAPGSFDSYVDAITSTLTGQFVYAGSDNRPYDIGLPGFFIQWDVMGQDLVQTYSNWWSAWYESTYLGPSYAYTQLPWTYFYGWIKSCNDVISMAGEEPTGEFATGAGIAYCMRAFYYMYLSQMYATEPYTVKPEAETIPIVTEKTIDLAHNPRAKNSDMMAFILADLDKAEKYLADFKREDFTTPDISVVYGVKARAYLTMGDWENAAKYAKLAQQGYTVMTEDQYTNWETGFNTANSAWMFGARQKADDPNITANDADSSWGSVMCMEISPETSACGYSANYGQFFVIDRHLYETIPASDFRKKCFITFDIDDQNMSDDDAMAVLANYTNHPDWFIQHRTNGNYNGVGGIELKFRTAGGEAGRANQYIGFVVDIPFMRVEEMVLIEAEATGMMNEAEGIAKLTAFAKTRDAEYVYGQHTENYGSVKASDFQNEIWWQRRVELWGEGFATKDIKRFQKGIHRSYPNTNHLDGYQWNTETTPEWMNLCIVQTETNYNYSCTNNLDPIAPTGNDAPSAQF